MNYYVLTKMNNIDKTKEEYVICYFEKPVNLFNNGLLTEVRYCQNDRLVMSSTTDVHLYQSQFTVDELIRKGIFERTKNGSIIYNRKLGRIPRFRLTDRFFRFIRKIVRGEK